ncbi:asparagine synthase B [Desertibacillus haloalkaliphilus]|uniref:asparagine synthase B n=1 Tax=Desertibacillus haloalkaliphilus TaxID=1328930 RepID=UPI001C278D7C|nr:asparagine synthase B [Desertibacillus haloalkaliphilus]MBU8908370.1 asparagine synthase B [Desertibacillus haloalkaliphilus]
MCGIFAVTGTIDNEKIDSMLESMTHRGPDEGDHVEVNNFHFGHRRLSIIGVDNGKQPISNREQSKYIVCNGEIYNYQHLKEQLKKTTTFKTDSDSEVPLKLYEAHGAKGVTYLDGMFAFVIADVENETFMAARDTLGIKPLYYGYDENGNMAFSSELKTLFHVTTDVKEFPQGHYYTPESGFVSYRRIKAPSQLLDKTNEVEILTGIQSILEKSVQKRLVADVEVGVLLSGGLDSSLIAAIAQKYRNQERPLHSFCVGIEGSPDIEAARDVAKSIGTIHHEHIYTKEELIDALPEVIYYLESYDPSLVRSAIPCYFVSKLAAKHVKVVLSGEGADELFSGYAYLQEITDETKLNEELIRIINSLHNINLQRLDRMSMAHSLEGRVPFLDLELIDYALKIPSSLKLSNEEEMEKALLRRAFEGVLPEHILWRKKAEFSEGSGAVDILESYANEAVTDEELVCAQNNESITIRSKQEWLYYKIFKNYYPQNSALETIGHWAVV